MTDPRSSLLTFPLTLGMDNVSHPEAVQPIGPRPRLTESRNTRLSKLPGCASKAPGCTLLSLASGTLGGAIPVGIGDSTLIPARVPADSMRVAASGVGSPTSTGQSETQNAYYPAQVLRAGVLPGSSTTRYNASCAYQASTGWTYYLSIRRSTTGRAGLFLDVLADDGAVITAGYLIEEFAFAVFTDERNYATVTVHGSDVILWYAYVGGASLFARTVTVSPTTLEVTLGSDTAVYSPVGGILGPAQTQVAYDPEDTTQAYVATQNSTVATSVTVLRVAVPALTTTTSATIALGGAGYTRLALAYRQGVAVILATSESAAAMSEYELDPTTLATSWSQTPVFAHGQPGCGFETRLGTTYRVFALSTLSVTSNSETSVEWRDFAGASAATGIIQHQNLIGQVVTVRGDDDTFFALFPTQVCYNPSDPQDSYDPDADGFIQDPSIEVFRMTWTAGVLAPSCVARLGVDLAIRYPGSLNPLDAAGLVPNQTFVGSSSSCIDAGQRVLVTYLQENVVEGSVAIGYAVRYAWLDFGAVQPRFATTSDGTAVVAGALPAIWDGHESTEFSPMRMSKVTGAVTGGFGPALTGTFRFASVWSWLDAHGQIHRSPPSNVISLSPAAQSPIVRITYHPTHRNGLSQFAFQTVIYESEDGGLTPYAQDYWLIQAQADFAVYSMYTDLDEIDEPIVDAFHPAIYTDGSEVQELPTFCPGACLDAAVVADRLWMLDAEQPGRWWFSKPKRSGIFLEMSPDLYIDTPSSAGRGVALSEWNGNPFFLTERGIWTVSGEGPDALNNPPFFSSAVQVSDVACTQRLSVVRSPAGVMFVSNNRFVRFSGQMIEYPEINATLHGDVVGVAVFRKQQEVCWFLEDGYAYVYNWVADAFTIWDQTVTGTTALTGCAQRADGKVVLVSTGDIRLLDPETVATAQMSLTTGHVPLGDKQDNNNLENIVLHARSGGSHDLVMGIAVDFNDVVAFKTRTAAEIANCTNVASVYDIQAEPANQAARAVRLVLRENATYAGEGFQPISVTLEVLKKPGKAVRNLPDAARV